jgi:CDP-diacylglycerol--glycerol-3-phosphate 3-phosphatidyltransferase
MGIYAVKPLFQSCLKGVERQLIKLSVSADAITISALVAAGFCAVACAFSARQPLLLLVCPLVAFIRTALNALDGMVARSTGTACATGEVLNEMCDRLADAFMLGGFAFSGLVDVHLAWSTVVAALLTECVSMAGKAAGGSRDNVGVMGKADRMILLSIASLLALAFPHANVLNYAYSFCLILCLVTVVQRCKSVNASLRQLSRSEQ